MKGILKKLKNDIRHIKNKHQVFEYTREKNNKPTHDKRTEEKNCSKQPSK